MNNAEQKEVSYVWLDYVSKSMIHDVKNKSTGKSFANISFDCDKSSNGIGTVSVNTGQIKECLYRNGETNENFRNVLLGKSGITRAVSIKDSDGNYNQVNMTTDEILENFIRGRDAYHSAQLQSQNEIVQHKAKNKKK